MQAIVRLHRKQMRLSAQSQPQSREESFKGYTFFNYTSFEFNCASRWSTRPGVTDLGDLGGIGKRRFLLALLAFPLHILSSQIQSPVSQVLCTLVLVLWVFLVQD